MHLGVRMIVELKMDDRLDITKHSCQAALVFLMADIAGDCEFSIVGLLTDLNHHWQFMWLEEEQKIVRKVFKQPKNAFQFTPLRLETRISNAVAEQNRLIKRKEFSDSFSVDYSDIVEDWYRNESMEDVMSPMELHNTRRGFAQKIVQSLPSYSSMYS